MVLPINSNNDAADKGCWGVFFLGGGQVFVNLQLNLVVESEYTLLLPLRMSKRQTCIMVPEGTIIHVPD